MSALPQTVPGALGSRNRFLALEGATVQVVEFPPDLLLPMHEHEHTTLYYVYEGAIRDVGGRQPVDYPRGTIVYLPARQPHAIRFGPEGASLLVAEFTPGRLRTLPAPAAVAVPLHLSSGVGDWLARQLHAELHHADTVSPNAVEGLLLALLAEAERPRAHAAAAAPAMRRCEAYLHEAFLQPVGLPQAAAAAGVHPSHLARTFRQAHGCTVGEYVRRLRLLWAADQLQHTGRPLHEIARSAGFCDQSHFTNLFRKLVGRTPAAYRAARRAPGKR